MRNRIAKIGLFLLSSLGFFSALVWILLNSISFQNYLSKYLTTFFRDELHTRFEIKHVKYTLFNQLEFEGLYLEDQQGDTLLYAKNLVAKFSLLDLAQQHVVINTASLTGAELSIAAYKNVKGINLDFLIDYFNPPRPKNTKRKPLPPWIVDVKSVSLKESVINYDDYSYKADTTGIFDYNHISLLDFNGKVSNLKLIDDSLITKIENISTREKCGLQIKSLKGNLTVSPTILKVEKFHATTPHSILKDQLVFKYKNWNELANFVDDVVLDVKLNESTIGMQDLAYFNSDLDSMHQLFNVSGNLTGKIPNLKSKNMEIGFGEKTRLAGSIRIKGLPETDETYLDIFIEDALTNQSDLSALLESEDIPKEFKRLGDITFSGEFNGFISDFVANGVFQTECGTIISDINLKIPGNGLPPEYGGELKLDKFNLGQLYSRPDLLGRITMNGTISGTGFQFKKMKAQVDAVINEIEFYGYPYQNLTIGAKLLEKTINGSVEINDPNVKLIFDGLVDLHPKRPVYKFASSVAFIKLKPLGFDTTNSEISLNAFTNISIKNIDDIDGSVHVKNIKVNRLGNSRTFNNLAFTAASLPSNHFLDLKSEFADAQIKGNYSLLDIGNAAKGFVNHFLPDYMKQPVDKISENFDISFHLKDGTVVHDLLFNHVVSKGIYVNGNFSNEENNLKLNIHADYISIDSILIIGLDGKTYKETQTGAFKISQTINQFKLTDSLDFRNVQFNASIKDDITQFTLLLGDSARRANAQLSGLASFSTDTVKIAFTKSRIGISNFQYTIDPSGKLIFTKGLLFVNNTQIHGDHGRFIMDGCIGPNEENEFKVRMLHVDLGVLNYFFQTVEGGVGGQLNGVFSGRKITSRPIISADIDIQDARLGSDTLGLVRLKSSYDEHIEVLTLNSFIEGGQLNGTSLGGHIALNDPANALNLYLKIPSTPLPFFEKFASDLISETEGIMTVNLDIKGPTSNPIITGSAFLDAAGITVNYLKTHYRFNQTFYFRKDEIDLGKFYVNDKNNHTALIQGKVFHKSFSDFVLDISLTKAKNFCLLETGPKDNSLFYGDAYASGSARFTGSIDNMQMDIDLKSDKGTVLNIPLSNPDEATSADFIRFMKKTDGSNKVVKRKVDLSGIQMNFNLEMTPDAQVQLLFDPALGDIIKGRGTGNIRLEINTRGDFSMYGQYTIEQGDYNFTALNVYQKKFIIKPGGTITWDGNPFTARMNLDAVYKLKASPSDLLGTTSTTPGPTGRVPVECNLYLKGQLLTPDIKFGISIPSVDAQNTDNNTQLVAVLEQLRNDPDEMNRQIFSLLILNRFLPRQGGNNQVATSTNLGAGSLNTTLSDLISAQLSQWLSQIDPNWQLNVRYQTGDDIRTKEWIIGISRNLFNDRLVVDGSYGIETQAANFNAQYMLTRDGRFRIRAFSRATTNPIQTQNQYYTHGLGFFYRKEFEYLFPKKNHKKY